MSVLSEQAEHEIAIGALDCLDKLVEIRMRQMNKFPYIKQSEMMEELGISTTYLPKLIKAGLKKVVLEKGDTTIWYKRSQLIELFDQLAE